MALVYVNVPHFDTQSDHSTDFPCISRNDLSRHAVSHCYTLPVQTGLKMSAF